VDGNFQPRAGFASALNDRSVVRGGIGRYHEKLFNGQASRLQAKGVFGESFIINFPLTNAEPGPSADGCRPIRCSSTVQP
jgi:hypothetical protein